MNQPMQPFQTVRDLLDELVDLHVTCHRRYVVAMADKADLRLGVLLAFLGKREAEQLTAVARLRCGADDVLACCVQNPPSAALAAARTHAVPDGDCDEVVASYRRREQALERFFGQLTASVGPRAGAIFADLLAMKRQNQARLREALLDF